MIIRRNQDTADGVAAAIRGELPELALQDNHIRVLLAAGGRMAASQISVVAGA